MLTFFNNQTFNYISVFLIAFLLNFFLCGYLVLRTKKNNKKSRLGGVFIIISFWLVLAIFLPIKGPLLGAFLASLVILVFGVADDFKNLHPGIQFAGQILAAVVAVSSGFLITYITNPFGGIFYFDSSTGASAKVDFFQVAGVSLVAYSITLLWFLVMMNTMNFLDGLDGLASGVSVISAMTLFFLSITSFVNQPGTAKISLILAGVIFGFLIFNLYPAKIYMGTSGSVFLGFILALLAIYAGAKIATAALVMGLPLLDFVFVILRRLKDGVPIWRADKRHLHYLLKERGFSERQIVIFYYFVSFALGVAAVLTESFGKLMLAGFLIILGLIIWRFVSVRKAV